MMERIRERLRLFFHPAVCRPRRSFRKREKYMAPIRGNMRSVIVVRPENPMFSEAVFILNDDYIRNHSSSHKELMQQANDAVAGYAAGVSGGFGGKTGRWWHLLASLFFAAALVVLWFVFKA